MNALHPQTILLATDFLESSRLALDYAVAFAYHYHARLLMLHVFHPTQAASEVEALHLGPSLSRQSREARLEALANSVRRIGVDAECRLVEGWMPEALLKQVEDIAPDLLVLGTHGVYRGLEHFVMGSNAEQMLLSASCPALTVGRHVPAGIAPELTLERILYVTDYTTESAAAAPHAVALSRDFHAPIEALCLLPEGRSEQRLQMADRYCETVHEALPGVEIPWCELDNPLKNAATAEEILVRVSSETGGLIVLGVKAGSYFAHQLSSSFAYQLVVRAASPVFTVRG
jgi:nucleotide-binding universal stress UspA family protein